jgi:hypothetical protein
VYRQRVNVMNRNRIVAILIAVLLLAGAAPDFAQAASPSVQVRYIHPKHFTETRFTPPSERIGSMDYLAPLKRYIEKRAAKVIQPGQKLSIEITDIKRAGNYEPWPGGPSGWMRVVRSDYPPRITLHFTLHGADGSVLKKGTRHLIGMGFMSWSMPGNSDPLRYEKTLIDHWLRHGENKL